MNPTTKLIITTLAATALTLPGCGNESPSATTPKSGPNNDAAHAHDHGPDADHDHAADAMNEDDHEEVSLGSVRFGDLEVELAQGHGELAPGKELHLVVKLPESDNGATVIRAWLGTEDRFASVVAKADYAPSHDDYDIHATAPDPLPENTRWWIEIERPDGTKLLESVKPL